MPDHPPEHHIRRGEEKAKQADPHGLGDAGTQQDRGEADPAAMPNSARHETETAHSRQGEKASQGSAPDK